MATHRKNKIALKTYMIDEDNMMVNKTGTEFIISHGADDTWAVDFYAPRVDTSSGHYRNLLQGCERIGLKYDYLKRDGDTKLSQIWIIGDLSDILHLLSLHCVQVEWSQYYVEQNNG